MRLAGELHLLMRLRFLTSELGAFVVKIRKEFGGAIEGTGGFSLSIFLFALRDTAVDGAPLRRRVIVVGVALGHDSDDAGDSHLKQPLRAGDGRGFGQSNEASPLAV